MNLKSLFISILLSISLLAPQFTLAMSQTEAVGMYIEELTKVGLPDAEAQKKADQESKALVEQMEGAQLDVKTAIEGLKIHVNSLRKNDSRREQAQAALDEANTKVNTFTGLSPQNSFDVQEAIAGALPRLLSSSDFEIAHQEALDAISEVNRVLIAPVRPGEVPEGDLVSDFIPQLVRQLYRFAWVVVLISFTVSGIFFVLAKDNDERITKAKGMIIGSFIGFAIVALSFAIIKAVTDIDFFGFI